ncbi:hypothetical protein [Nocardioides sp. CFH 31398]|uniref:hypothetical protein n=1 Tax=Nocardioides sp. CFH 31398 TaxID=2919579 RepID=UPI001F055AB3|nr:hypothetical protein [Nocardioides sp. CFH 31398]MCH1865978.1 hypothetical protein [Nocardioides sp. CFH 31398]
MSAKLVLTGTVAALAIGVVSLVGVTAASADAPTASGTVVSAPASQGSDVDDPHAGLPLGGSFGDLGELMAAVPAALRSDLEDAAQAGDPGDVLRALAEVHDQAAAGEYGADVREKVDALEAQLPTEAQLQQLMDTHLGALPIEIPAALRQAVVEAAGNGDAGQRLTALADVHDGALDGEYGAQARTLVQQLGAFLEQMDTRGGFPGMGSLGA